MNWKRISFEEAKKKVPDLPRGWYELARFPKKQRVGFVKALWRQFLPDFDGVDAIKSVELVLNEGRALLKYLIGSEAFWGAVPATMPQIARIAEVIDCEFPEDFCAFYQIHNGFGREGEESILPLQQMRSVHNVLTVQIGQLDQEMLFQGEAIDPISLVPFYEKNHGKIYQCFFKPWVVDGKMGNVQCALGEGYIADPQSGIGEMLNPAFETFTRWLSYYVESEKDSYCR